jgi:protein O-mannosyl-transferase
MSKKRRGSKSSIPSTLLPPDIHVGACSGSGLAPVPPEGEKSLPNAFFHTGVLICLFLFFISFLYGSSLNHGFTNWDDQMIYGNPVIRSLNWKTILQIFTPQRASTYQPIRLLSYAVDYHFWGLDPLGYRLTNLFFYLLTCILLFFTTRLLLRRILSSSRQASDRMAFFTAFIFAAHPVHVEAVVWLSARKEALHGFFLFLSFYLYMKTGEVQERKKRWLYIGLVLTTFLLAILSKPSAVVMPALILIYEITRREGKVRSFLREHRSFIVASIGISLLFMAILFKAMSEAGGIKPYYGGSMASNWIISVYLILYNIKLLAFTTAYSAAYTITASISVLSKWTILVFSTTLFLFLAVVWSKRKTNLFFFSFFWFLITVLPFLNIIPISTLLADRYVYLASFGYCLVVGFLLNRLYETRKGLSSSVFFKVLALSLFLGLLGSYSWMTLQQNRVWKDSFHLWADVLKKYPWSSLGNSMMGSVFLQRGENEKAARYLERAINIRPTDGISRCNLGIAYARLNQPDKALKEFLEAIRLRPDDDLPQIELSTFYFLQKEYQKSEEVLKGLLRRNPTNAALHLRLGELYRTTDRLPEAVSQIEEAIRLEPQGLDAYEALGSLYLSNLGDLQKAADYYTRAVQMAPESSPKIDEFRWIVQDLAHHR